MKRLLVVGALASSLWAADAAAFCGFFVGGAGADLYANATQVVAMRDGTQTILSMQNRYDGPLADFAMVVPVPSVLSQDDVKTLDEGVFERIDRLTAPRLVEYQQVDPCHINCPGPPSSGCNYNNAPANNVVDAGTSNNGSVVVEAQFKVGEYDIAILSADDSAALETYLTDNGYNIPDGAAPYFQPYIQSGMYFFVAKVDITKVPDVNGTKVLSPLRFAYTSPEFSLPVRLGMINSNGVQDLIVYTLGRDQRYEVANKPNVTIPTNIEMTTDTKANFGAAYQSLLARTYKVNPDAVITEYAWQAQHCDPCPSPVMDASELAILGADLLEEGAAWDQSWVVTRLHARYDKDEVGEDLIFRAAPAIEGGRGTPNATELPQDASPNDFNAFQGRYILKYPWTGVVNCANPNFDRWDTTAGSTPSPNSTGGDIILDESVNLASIVIGDVPELSLTGTGQRLVGTQPSGDTSGTRTCPTYPEPEPCEDFWNNGSGNNGTGNNGAGLTPGDGSDSGGCNSVEFGALPLAFGFLALARRRRRKFNGETP